MQPFDCIKMVVTMNPCGCGYYPDRNRCRCSQPALRRYFDKVSQPLLDRMDICMEAPGVTYRDLVGNYVNESSEDIRRRVIACHEIQKKRYAGEDFCFNSRIPASSIRKFCPLGEKEERYMENIFHKMELTARTYHKILRVARTIADMDHSAEIGLAHLNEAVCYRSMDERFWGGLYE